MSCGSPVQLQSLIFDRFSTSTFVTDVSGRVWGLDGPRQCGTTEGDCCGGITGAGCRFRAQLPVTLATVRVSCRSWRKAYAIPVENMRHRMVSPDEIFPIAGRTTVTLDGRPVSVARLSELLSLNPHPPLIKRGARGVTIIFSRW